MTIIWVGGGSYPAGGYEYNLLADIKAANVVFSSQVPLWQIPAGTYKQIGVTLAELQYHVKPCGAIGRYLFEQMAEFNEKVKIFPLFPHGESWGLGDSAPVGERVEQYLERSPGQCITDREERTLDAFIDMHAKTENTWNQYACLLINAGTAADLLNAGIQQQILDDQEQLGFFVCTVLGYLRSPAVS